MTPEQIAAWAREAGFKVVSNWQTGAPYINPDDWIGGHGYNAMAGTGYIREVHGPQMTAYLARFAALVAAHERERCAGGNDLEAMCEAFHRLIEAHANLRSPFHNPVNADAQMALRVLRGVVAALGKSKSAAA